MPNVSELISAATKTLEDIGSVEARLEAEVLLAASFHQSRSWVIAHLRDHVPEGVIRSLKSKLSRRGRREPLPYILGKREFYGLEFKVTPAVLIPRQETELLVDAVREWAAERPATAIDLGAGSGCVGIAIAAFAPHVSVVAVERFTGAAAVAKANAEAHKERFGERWSLVVGDWLSALRSNSADAIAANLPYVGLRERDTLAPEVRDWEPPGALFAGDDGLEVFRVVIPDALRALKPSGLLALEIGAGQAKSVADIVRASGFEKPDVRYDLAGIARVVTATRPISGM